MFNKIRHIIFGAVTALLAGCIGTQENERESKNNFEKGTVVENKRGGKVVLKTRNSYCAVFEKRDSGIFLINECDSKGDPALVTTRWIFPNGSSTERKYRVSWNGSRPIRYPTSWREHVIIGVEEIKFPGYIGTEALNKIQTSVDNQSGTRLGKIWNTDPFRSIYIAVNASATEGPERTQAHLVLAPGKGNYIIQSLKGDFKYDWHAVLYDPNPDW